MRINQEMILRKTLYYIGPPGTGKTYNTAYYSVAICEDVSIDAVEKQSYEEVLKKI